MTFFRAITAAWALAIPAAALAVTPIVVHRDPGCSCCEQWAAQVRAAFGRKLFLIDDAKRQAFQTAHKVPAKLSSCHTAIVDGLIFEGHVPTADMKRLLAQRPRGIAGLAVAGMPMGSPGMDAAGQPAQHYDVLAFGPAGTRVFARH